MGDTFELVLRVVHIFCGVFWAGAAMMIAGFVGPAVAALGPDGGKLMQRMMGPGRFGPFMSGAAILTSVSGLAMLWVGSVAGWGVWLESAYGRAIVIGSVLGLAGLVLGLAVNAPTAARMARIGRQLQETGGPPAAERLAELSRLQKRLHDAGLGSATLLGLSVVAMAAARYL